MANLPLGKRKAILLSFLLFVNVADFFFLAKADAESKVYIVYLGRKQHDDHELVTASHHEMLSTVLGSKEASADSMVYSYKHGFSGFAAKLTPSQAQEIAALPSVLHVIPNHFYELQTTRSWDYLGLSFNSATNLLHDSKMGEDAIIGVIDTGVWPESEAFNDEGMGPIPSKWKGFCQAGTRFDPKKNCNRKLIGARYFRDGLLAQLGNKKLNTSKFQDYLSARDAMGHGTHTASTAGGSFVSNVSHNGLGYGTARGGAPRSRLAIYKALWTDGATSADILKAFDEAIHDGVDVLSVSLGISLPLYSEVDKRDIIYFGSFHAVEKGITVVCAGGNSGPASQTVLNVAPWVISVAASTIDRSFPTIITLGNNQTLMGQALYSGKDTDVVTLAYRETKLSQLPWRCESVTRKDTWMAGKIVLCFTKSSSLQEIYKVKEIVPNTGAVGLIIAKDPIKTLDISNDDSFPFVQVNYQTGTEILNYIRSTRFPKAQLRSSKTYVGKPLSTYVASFSSRGPNTLAPSILKPDVAGPGANILAAVPTKKGTDIGYDFLSGTSMATPHVAGITALLKTLHPNWSPAAIKSALVTTAWITDPSSGEPIFAEGMRTKAADPFDFGGGIVNPNRARDPGLVYDMGTTDYIHYLCARGYDNSAINQLTEQHISCPKNSISLLDLNLPSITIPSLSNSTTVTRTVTNVGGANSIYEATVEAPQGYTIEVRPNYLKFTSKIKSISFTVTISTSHQVVTEFYFGSLTWTSGVHKVRIPISIKTEIPGYIV